MKPLLSLYSWQYPAVLVYMLQGTEYKVPAYLHWLHRTKDFNKVMYRRKLERTTVAKTLVLVLRAGILVQLTLGIGLFAVGVANDNLAFICFGAATMALYPIVWAYLVAVPLQLGRWLIMNPKYRREVKASEAIFAKHPGITIAVAGSYGKTTMKELLSTVLSEGKKVAATPANKNVAISHARFAQKLKGDEDVLVIEYGEGGPGDVSRFARITHPDIGVVTGLAPAHLDNYPSLQAAGEDIFSLAKYVDKTSMYVNDESLATKDFMKPDMHTYNSKEVLGWAIHGIKLTFAGTSFSMKKGDKTITLQSGLLGKHQVGPLALVAALGLELGLSEAQVKAGIDKTKAFEHRMQPRQIKGAWILDDTYNGNIDGMKAGLELLKELPAKRRIYVTPGLVDQGEETGAVHLELGEAIAKSKPDKVVLMYNSVTRFIEEGLKKGGFEGQLQVEHYPLDFYLNIEHFIATGDVVMLQNDWTDNYS